MVRLLAVIVVGCAVLAVLPIGFGAGAQDDRVEELNREIEDLRHRISVLEQRGTAVGDLTCPSGEIAGELSITDAGGFYTATLRWAPKTTPSNVNNPLANRGVGAAELRGCS